MVNHQYIETLAVTILAALIGLSLPMIMQIVQRLDQKYSSILIANRFREELWYRCYRRLVWVSIGFSLFLPFAPKSPIDCWILNHSAHLLTWGCLIFTLWSLNRVSNLIVEYETPNKLLGRIAEKSDNIYNDAKRFNVFFDFMKFSMIAGDNELYLKCNAIFGECVGLLRGNKNGQEFVYPEYVYKAVSESLLVCQKNYDSMLLPSLNSPYLPMTIYFDDTGQTLMSQPTYLNLWKNLLQLASSNKEDWIKGYWVYANQYASYTLDNKRRKSENEIYEQHFRQFVQLHHVFLAYILAHNKIDLIKWTFRYTNSSLEQYLLIAKDFHSILEYGTELLDLFGVIIIETRYTFYQEEGIRTGSYIQSWIMRYYVYSLLYQFNRWQHKEIVSNPLNFHSVISDEKEGKMMLEIIECLRNILLKEQKYFNDLGIPEKLIHKVEEYFESIISKISDKIEEYVSQVAVDEDQIQKGKLLLNDGIKSNLSAFSVFTGRELSKFEPENFTGKISLSTSKYNYSLAQTSFLNNMVPSLCFGIMRQVNEKYVRCILSNPAKKRYKIDFDEVEDALDALKVNESNESILPIAHTFSSKKYKSLAPLSGSESCILILNADSLPQVKFLNNSRIKFTSDNDDLFVGAEAEFLFQIPKDVDYIRLDIINSLFDGKSSDLGLLRGSKTDKDNCQNQS